MSPRFTVAVAGAAIALLLGGCRADDRAAAPPAPSVPVTAAASAGSADPLAGVESVVDDVERDLDADAGVAGR